MSPDVSKDKVVEVGRGGKACGMAVVTTPAADLQKGNNPKIGPKIGMRPLPTTLSAPSPVHISPLSEPVPPPAPLVPAPGPAVAAAWDPEESVILTSFLSYSKDPQRGTQVQTTIDYIRNFYLTLRFHQLQAVIFHDSLSANFIAKYGTSLIKFEKVVPGRSMSTNDFRFKAYREYLGRTQHNWVLMTDASDVFFNSNPFDYMIQHEHGHMLFMSPDIGTIKSNGWMQNMMKRCYKVNTNSADIYNSKLYNAGVWGGHQSVVQCMVSCVEHQLAGDLKGRGNCNMPAVNWCILHGKCIVDSMHIDDAPVFINPFREECDKPHPVIHNKCPNSHMSCVDVVNGKLQLSQKEPGTGRCSKAIEVDELPKSGNAITDVKPIDIHDTSAGKYDSYVKKQVAKLNNPAHHDNIKRNDKAIIEAVLHRRFVKYQSSGVVDFKGKHTVCVGARLGGEVRAMRSLEAIAVGVDLNPGEKNPHVLLGDAHSIGFAPGSVEILYSNVLDHILNLDNFVEQVAGVLSGGGLFLVDLSKKAADEYAVHDFRKEKAVFMNLLQSHFTIVSELDESQPESVWFIVAKRKVRNDGKIGSADAVLVVGDGLSAVSSKAVELREKGAFVVAMSPDVSKDKVVLACSTDISSSAFAQVVEVGSGGKACGMAVVTTPAADLQKGNNPKIGPKMGMRPLPTTLSAPSPVHISPLSEPVPPPAPLAPAPGPAVAAAWDPEESVILTSFLSYSKDLQRGTQVQTT